MSETRETIPEIRVQTTEKSKPQPIRGHPYIAELGYDLLKGVTVKRRVIEEIIYENLPGAAIAEMAARLRKMNIQFFRENPEHPETTVSFYIRYIGISPFRKLNDPCAVIELHEEIGSDETIIDVSSGVEPFICSGSTPLIPRCIN